MDNEQSLNVGIRTQRRAVEISFGRVALEDPRVGLDFVAATPCVERFNGKQRSMMIMVSDEVHDGFLA